MKARLGSGGIVLWRPGGVPVAAHALWFGWAKATVSCAEMAALAWGLELLVERGATGKVLVLGDSQLTIDCCTCCASLGVPDLYKGLKHIQQQLGAHVTFRHVSRNVNQLADWLTRVAKQLGRSVDVVSTVPADLGLFASPPWDFKRADQRISKMMPITWHDIATGLT